MRQTTVIFHLCRVQVRLAVVCLATGLPGLIGRPRAVCLSHGGARNFQVSKEEEEEYDDEEEESKPPTLPPRQAVGAAYPASPPPGLGCGHAGPGGPRDGSDLLAQRDAELAELRSQLVSLRTERDTLHKRVSLRLVCSHLLLRVERCSHLLLSVERCSHLLLSVERCSHLLFSVERCSHLLFSVERCSHLLFSVERCSHLLLSVETQCRLV